MKVSKSWLKELVDLKIPVDDLVRLLPLRTIGTKDITEDFIELDMKGYNRADLLSMRGVAYEIAAITDSDVKFDETSDPDFFWTDQSLPKVNVEVADEDLCPVYTVAKIEGLEVGPSPDEWVKKLADSGMRSVNNIADVTNLIMLEYGQPLHAFDAKTVKDETIIVRTAKKGEKLETLDGKTRDLKEFDLLIADPEKPIGLAGVMGGKNTEVTENTSVILLEAAIFDGKNLRKTAQRLNLQSEAGKRFQHGLTKKRLLQALNAAVKMYEQIGGKVTALTIEGDTEDLHKKIPVTLEKVNNLIGVEVKPGKVEKYLKTLNFEISSVEKDKWVVTPPYCRLDVEIEEDVIEEIARMYGYEKIPSKELAGPNPSQTNQKLFELIYNLKEALAEAGLAEVQTYSYYTTKTLEALGWYEDDNLKYLVKVANPISSETEYMRQNIWPNLVEVIDANLRNGYKEIAVFEVGKAYFVYGNEVKEQYRLAIGVSDNTDNPLPYLNEVLKSVMKKIGKDINVKVSKQDGPLPPLFHPTRFVQLEVDGKFLGGMAEVHPRILNKYGVEKRVAMLEINLDNLIS